MSDTQVSHGVFNLGMAKQELNHPQVLRPPVDQRRLGWPHDVGAVSADIPPDFAHPAADNPGVLSR